MENISAVISAGYAFMAAAVNDANLAPGNAYLQRESNVSLLREGGIGLTTAGSAVALAYLHSGLPKVCTLFCLVVFTSYAIWCS